MKTKKLLLLTFILLNACSGSKLVENDANASLTATKTITVSSRHQGSALSEDLLPDYLLEDGSKEFINDLGVTITLNKALLSWGHLFLISAGNDAECEAGFDTEVHLETIENILEEDAVERELGTATIEDHAYCNFIFELTPDNAESPGVVENMEALGHSIYLSGLWNDGTTSGTFEVKITEEILTAEGPFLSSHDGALSEHPLHFHEGEEAKTRSFVNVYDRWFDGIGFSESEEERLQLIKENILNHLQQHFEGH